MAKIFVIAGNSQQATEWIKGNAQKRWDNGDTSSTLSDYIIVNNRMNMTGHRKPHGVFIGTWKQRPDIAYIVTDLMDATYETNLTLRKIWNEIYPNSAI